MNKPSPEWSTNAARALRLITIRGYFASGYLTESDALDLLNGLLDPQDPTTLVDDRELLHDEAAADRLFSGGDSEKTT